MAPSYVRLLRSLILYTADLHSAKNNPANKVVWLSSHVSSTCRVRDCAAEAALGIHGRDAIHQWFHLIFNLDFYEP